MVRFGAVPNKCPRKFDRSLTSNGCINAYVSYTVKILVFEVRNFSECEMTADSFRSSFESDLQSKMGEADYVNTVAAKCVETSSSAARKRRSITFNVEMEISLATILTDQSQSVVTDTESIQNLVSDTLTETVDDFAEIVDFEVVSLEFEESLVEQSSVDEAPIEGRF